MNKGKRIDATYINNPHWTTSSCHGSNECLGCHGLLEDVRGSENPISAPGTRGDSPRLRNFRRRRRDNCLQRCTLLRAHSQTESHSRRAQPLRKHWFSVSERKLERRPETKFHPRRVNSQLVEGSDVHAKIKSEQGRIIAPPIMRGSLDSGSAVPPPRRTIF